MKNINDFVDKSNKSKNEKKESNTELFKNIPEDSVFIEPVAKINNFANFGSKTPILQKNRSTYRKK